MKTISRLILFISLALGARAALPPDAVVVEAETMHISGNGWEVRENFDGWFKGWTTGNKCLYGAIQGEGEATAKLICPSNGVYHIWARYLDLGLKHRSGDNCFIIEALQEEASASKSDKLDLDEILAADAPAGGIMADSLPVERKNTKKFDTFSLRIGKEAEVKWGDSFAAFVWDKMEATLRKGEYTLRISKSHPRRAERHQRLIDCIIITSDKTYEPIVEDFSPLYVRFDVPEERDNALRFLLRSRRCDGSDFFEHVSFATPFVQPVKPGKSSDWIEISKYLKSGKLGQYNRVTLTSFVNKRGEKLDADYTVSFATNPSSDAIIKTFERKGTGSGVSFRIDLLNPNGILSEIEESESNVARSLATPAIGRYPTKFVFKTSCAVSTALDQTFKNEMQALRNLGINQLSFSPTQVERYANEGFTRTKVGFYIWNLKSEPKDSNAGECFLNPNIEAITSAADEAEETAQKFPPEIVVERLAGFADEPGFNYLEHVPKCPICRAAFPKYLKAMNVPYEIFAAEADEIAMDNLLTDETPPTDSSTGIDSVRPCADTNRPHHFYWTSRFGINTVTEFIRAGTMAAEKNDPAWRTTMNFGNLRSTLAGTGLDWFEIFRTKAMTYAENEDYLAWSKNFQIRGYPVAVMRAACKTHGYTYGPLACYPGNNGWELIAGGFSQIGQGAKYIAFFNYGPHYIPASSPCSEYSWVHDSTRHLTYATGAVEDDLCGAQVMTGDVALLLSSTSDIWNYNLAPGADQGFSNLYGMERNYLYLVLRHLQASVDILAEEDLAADLQKYRMLFVTDSHLRREYAKAIQGWVEAGGALYVGANALALDEYNKPLGLIEELGVKRGLMNVDRDLIPGRPEYELRHRPSLGLVQTPQPFNAIFATQPLEGGETIFADGTGSPAMISVNCGKGRVIAGYTFPAMEYIKTSDWNKELKIFSTVIFQSGAREFIGKALELGGIEPKAKCSNMFLEANLLENGPVVIVSLANWSGEEQEATIVFRGLGKVKDVQAVRSAIKIVSRSDEELIVAGVFGSGDFLKILR